MPSTKENVAAMRQRIRELEKQVASKSQISFKVSNKGAISIYGLQRFPVTLYAEQWELILDNQNPLLKFIQDNEDHLKRRE